MAGTVKGDRSRVVRAAVQLALPFFEKDSDAVRRVEAGLPLSGEPGDLLTLDSELAKDVSTVVNETGESRGKILLEAIRAGLQGVYNKAMREKVITAQNKDPAEATALLEIMEHSDLLQDPGGRELRNALKARGALQIRLNDLVQHVPQAKKRYDAMNRLTELRHQPGGIGGGLPHGLSTDEMEWQIKMSEKHGPHPATWPQAEVLAHNARREKQRQQRPESK